MDEVRRRLLSLPDRLPPPPPGLRPTILASDGTSLPGVPLPPAGVSREAAVLVLLYPDAADEAHIVLTERPAGELRHSGEVSLPGGAMETTDASAVAAALREAREEVGLNTETAGVEVLGTLSPLEISVSGFRLTPVLAVALRRPTFRPDPREVATLLEARIESFLSGAPIEQVEEERRGIPIRYGAYLVAGYRVWGATAAILGQLGAIIGPFTKAATAD